MISHFQKNIHGIHRAVSNSSEGYTYLLIRLPNELLYFCTT
jgi:hypothetical protein